MAWQAILAAFATSSALLALTGAPQGGKKIVHLFEVGADRFCRTANLSPNGEVVAIAYDKPNGEGEMRLLATESGRELAILSENPASINRLVFTEDSRTIISGGNDGDCSIWNIAMRKLTGKLKGRRGKILDLAVRPGHSQVAACWGDDVVTLWDLNTRLVLTNLVKHQQANRLCFSPDGSKLAVADGESIRVWDIEGSRQVHVMQAHEKAVKCLAFGADGKRLITAGGDGRITLWDANKWRILANWDQGDDDAVSVAVSPRGDVAAIGEWSGEVAFLNVSEEMRPRDVGRDVVVSKTAFLAHQMPVSGLGYRRDGKMLLSASIDGTVKVWLTP
jgi:WD40 repeat protein